MFRQYRTLIFLAIIAFTFTFFIPNLFQLNETSYPIPVIKNSESKLIYQNFVNKYHLNTGSSSLMITLSTDYNLGRFMQEHGYTQNQVDKIAKKVPIYNIMVSPETGGTTLFIDPITKKANAANFLYLPAKSDVQIKNFAKGFFDESIVYQKKHEIQLPFDPTASGSPGKAVEYLFKGKFSSHDINEKITVLVQNGKILKIERLGTANHADYQNSTNPFTSLIMAIGILIFIVLLLITVFIFVLKTVKKQISSYTFAVLPSIVVFISSAIIIYILSDAIDIIALLQPIFESLFVYFALTVYSSRKKKIKLTEWKKPIFLGFLFAAIALFFDTAFYEAALKMGSWSSGVETYSIFMLDHQWLILLFPLAIGISAAVSEEVIARFYFDKAFHKLPVIIAALLSSLFWSVLHLEYEVYPWYLRIIELTIFIGPFLYYIYKKYGLKTSIATHYFFDGFYCSLSFIGMDVKTGVSISLISLLPLLSLLIKEKKIES